MSSASHAVCDRIQLKFGDLDPEAPAKYLRDNGYIIVNCIIYPGSLDKKPTQDEMDCIKFLAYEWDYRYNGTIHT